MCRRTRGAAECDAGQARQRHRRICWPGRQTGADPADDQWLPWGTWEPGAQTLSWPQRSEQTVGSCSGLLCWASWEPALWWRSWSIAGRGIAPATCWTEQWTLEPAGLHTTLGWQGTRCQGLTLSWGSGSGKGFWPPFPVWRMAVPVALAQRQTTGEDWVVVGRGDQEEAADDEQQQKVRLGMLEVTADDHRLVRWEGGWGLEVTADDQRPVRWVWGLEATADDQRPVWWGGGWRQQLMTRGRGVSCGGRSGSGNWSQRGGRVKVKGLRSSRVLPVKMSVEQTLGQTFRANSRH